MPIDPKRHAELIETLETTGLHYHALGVAGALKAATSDPHHLKRLEAMSGSGYPKFRNDRGVPEICIGVKEFKCIGVSPPQDHPHIYLNMRQADTILCPYCGTRFRFDTRLTPLDADPPDSVFDDNNST
jgi:uncharacterized Zn-finger protein